MQAFFTKIFSSFVSTLSGPFKWVAGILLDKLLTALINGSKEGFRLIMQAIADRKRRAQNAQADAIYKDTLKDGVKNDDQINASTDILNSNRDK